MSITKYDIDYDFNTVATVNIDHAIADPHIKEMVEFWMGWEDAVEDCGGDYTKRWLINLGRFIMANHRPPSDDEGWVPLAGEHGISIAWWERWRPDTDSFNIQKRS